MADTYHLDLSRITIDEFFETLRDGNISPGRTILLKDKEKRQKRLCDHGIGTLADLAAALKTKKRVSELAGTTGIAEEYLTILGRQARSYMPSPVSIERFSGVTPDVAKALKRAGVTQTKQLFDARRAAPSTRAFADAVGLERKQIADLLVMGDLVRINGVGPVFAGLFLEAGVKSLADLAKRDPREMLEAVNEAIESQGYHGPAATLWDIQHCVEFAARLESD